MDMKPIVAALVGAAIASVVGIIVAGLFGTFTAGSDALTEDQIKSVMAEILVTPQGKSFGAEIANINIRLTAIETTLNQHTRTLEILTN